MDRDEALELLRGGKDGVEEWNKRRGADGNIPSLHQVSLRGAILSGANLYSANLTGADLTGAKLIEATLIATSFRQAKLNEADLSGANLGGAILHGADVRRTDFSGAILLRTVFGDLDLSEAEGLDTVVHHAPSTIGTDTLYRSAGKIPEVFLRGVGLPESLIVQIPFLIGAEGPVQFYSVFISYSHADKSFARRLHNDLQALGIRCWLDEHQLRPGDDIYAEVDNAVRLWDKVLLCCSKEALESWWVERELDTAFEKERMLHEERGENVLAIIPLNLDGYLFEWNGAHAAALRKRLAPDFTGWESDNTKYEAQLEAVVGALRADPGAREPAPEPKL